MGNPDCQIHAATHCTLSTSELCFVVLSEKNPAAMQSWVCRLSEAPCRTRVCWIIRCSLPLEVSQLPNLALFFLLVGSCRVSWVVQALKPATTTQQYQGHVVCNLLLDGPLLHFFPWQPLEGVRRISIVRLVKLLTIVWIVLALFGICPISAANKCTSSIPSNPHLQCQIWVIFFNWVLVTTYIMFFEDFEGRHFTLPSMQRVFDLSSDCSAFWFRCCFSGALLHLEIRTVLCSDSLFDTKPINVKSWEHDPQSNLSLRQIWSATKPHAMPCGKVWVSANFSSCEVVQYYNQACHRPWWLGNQCQHHATALISMLRQDSGFAEISHMMGTLEWRWCGWWMLGIFTEHHFGGTLLHTPQETMVRRLKRWQPYRMATPNPSDTVTLMIFDDYDCI